MTLAAVVGLGWLGYVISQKPKIWCDREWAGICFVNGDYRSWSLRFCDGQTLIDGKMEHVVITTNGYRKGYYPWPKFRHVHVRNAKITGDSQP